METLQRNANRGSVSTKFRVENSVKMDHRNSERFYRNNPTAGNKRTFTISLWTKLAGPVQDEGDPYIASQGSNARFHYAGNTLRFMFDGGSTELEATAKLRDVAAWYHIVLAVDTTQGTAANRVKAYVNGQSYPWNNTKYPSQNQEGSWMSGTDMYFNSRDGDGSYDTSSYMTEVAVIDGSQLQASDFGEYDDSGIWKCKDFKDDVTFGSEGFYYKFDDASDIGADSSGNGNDATLVNITSADLATDTPTNNFCVLNGHTHVGNQYGRYVQRNKEGNTQPDEPTGSFGGVWGTHSFSSGKWYWEAKSYLPSSVNLQTFGVASCKNCSGPEDDVSGFHPGESQYGLYPDANAGIYPTNAQTISYKGSTANTSNDNLGANSNGSIWQIAFDADNGKIWFGKNNTWMNTTSGTSVSASDIAAGNNPRYDNLNNDAEGPWMPCFGMYNANEGHHMDVNFGGYTAATPSSGETDQNGYGNFEYAPPSGFLAICSENLSEINTIDDPSEHFQVETYNGGGSSSTVTFSGNSDLQPDFLWIKRRNAGYGHNLFDTTRGIAKLLESDNNNTENTNQTWISSVGSDSFTIGVNEHNLSNTSGTYVAWAWKANGGSVSNNTDGGYTVSLQANQTAGFSIGTYTGSGGNSPSATNVGHGLGIAPEFVIIRARNRQENWSAYHSASGTGGFILDNNTAHNNNSVLGDALATATVVDLGTDLRMNGGYNYVMYSWAPIEGYSIFGKYHGNGYHNTAGGYPTGKDGPFVHTGFRPALIFIKCDSTTGSWTVYDEKRDGNNANNDALFWNAVSDESSGNISGADIDIFSNGFKIKSNDNTINASGGIYTYGAWAAHPQQTSTGVPGTGRCF